MPIQRIPRFCLLLKDLVKFTPEKHIDYLNLSTAFERMNKVAAYVNESKREYENLQRVVDIQDQFVGVENLVAPHRKYMRDGELKVNNGEKLQFFLFNDILVYSKKQSYFSSTFNLAQTQTAQYKLVGVFSLLEIDIANVSDYAFEIHLFDQRMIVEADTTNTKESWLNDLQKAINQLIEDGERKKDFKVSQQTEVPSNKKVKAVWISDDNSPECMTCKSAFTILNRRHHCRACGGVFCASCAAEKCYLPEFGYKEMVRVCKTCYKSFIKS